MNTTYTQLQINSETDFVAKNERFRDLVRSVAQTALQSDLPVKTGKCAYLLCACLLGCYDAASAYHLHLHLHLHISLCVAQHDIQHQIHTTTHCMLFLVWSLLHILSSSVYKTLETTQICTRVCASHMKFHTCNLIQAAMKSAWMLWLHKRRPQVQGVPHKSRCSHCLCNCIHQVLSIALIPAHICTCVVQQLHTPMRFCCDSTCIRLQMFAHILQYNHRGGLSKQLQPRSFL